ncbi:MAG: putative zinc-binding protein [Chloroflexi bacterium]|nr:putative zinc-binding protein [Chloroflexota bacterium]
MVEECTCEASEVLLFPCSGGSNCGQIANQVAVQLTEGNVGKMYCLAGIGAHESVMLDTTRAARRVVAIDGCTVACARKTIEHAGLTVTDWICVTDEGISKTHEFKLALEEIGLIIRRTRESLAKPLGVSG